MSLKKLYFPHIAVFLALLTSGFILPYANAEEELEAREYLLKAKVIHSISHFITWPQKSKTNKFNLCILGEKPEFKQALKLFYQHTPLFENKNIDIVSTGLDTVDNCSILFIPELSHSELLTTVARLKHKPILLFSDNIGYAEQGIHVNLYVDNNKVRFEVNFEASKIAGLDMSSQLLRLAKIVKDKG